MPLFLAPSGKQKTTLTTTHTHSTNIQSLRQAYGTTVNDAINLTNTVMLDQKISKLELVK